MCENAGGNQVGAKRQHGSVINSITNRPLRDTQNDNAAFMLLHAQFLHHPEVV
jgi:hypothetical protein